MIQIQRLNENNIGLAFSCAKDAGIWGSQIHAISNNILIKRPDKFFAYGITYDNEPIGHSIVVDTDMPFSPVEADKSVFVHCFYIAPQFRDKDFGTLLYNYIDNDLIKMNIKAIFFQVTDSKNPYSRFFKSRGFTALVDNDIITLLVKFHKKTDFKIKEFSSHMKNNNILTVNYNPLCPITFSHYQQAVIKIRKELPEIKIVENYLTDDKQIRECGYFGFYYGNTPILINPQKSTKLINMLKKMTFRN